MRAPATKRSQRTRSELACATHAEVADSGTVNVEAIASAANVSTATFYAHFSTHDDALAAALDISLTNIVGVVEQHFDIAPMIEDGLQTVVRRLVRLHHRAFRSENLVLRAALARVSQHRLTRDTYREHELRSHRHLVRHIELGQKAGLLRAGSPDRRATSMMVLLQSLQNPLVTKRQRLDRLIADDLGRAILSLLSASAGSAAEFVEDPRHDAARA